MKKPREFWLAAKADCQLEVFEFPCVDMSNWYRAVRVIEYSAYQSALDKLARAEEALRFYSDEAFIQKVTIGGFGYYEAWENDKGKRAREYFEKEKV